MSLTIALQNTGNTNQLITLFDNGGLGSSSFITANSTFTAQSVVSSASGGVPSTQQVSNSGTIYYNAVFNPSTGYYYGGVGTTLGVIATINGSSYSYVQAISSVANRTFNDIQTLLTNQLRNDGTNPRPNAQVVLSVSTSNGIQYLTANVLDTINSNESITYDSISLYFDSTDVGFGSSTPTYLDQIYTSASGQPSPRLYPANSPSTTFADSDGWFTIQGNNLTTTQSCIFRIYDTYLQSIPTNAGYAFNFAFQLTEPISTGNFIVLNYPSLTLLFSITGSSTAVQQFSGIVPNGSSIVITNASAITSWNGQLKMRIQGMTGSNSIKGNSTISLLNQLNDGATYLSSNPNVLGKISANGVGLQEILNSANGNSYKVTSLYIWSINQNQLTQSITYGTIDANGNIFEQELDIVIDPFAQNSVTYRTNGMNDFVIDTNAIIQFVLLAKSSVNMKFEFEKNGSDEIKLVEMGLGGLLAEQYDEKSQIDAQLADDFDTFYLKQ